MVVLRDIGEHFIGEIDRGQSGNTRVVSKDIRRVDLSQIEISFESCVDHT